MIIKTISITYNRKFNLGDYNSAEIGCSLWADLDIEDVVQNAFSELFDLAKTTVKEQALPIVKRDRQVAAGIVQREE